MSKIRGSATVLAILFAGALILSGTWNPPAPERFVPIGGAQVPQTIMGYSAMQDAPTSVTDQMRAILSSANIVARSYIPETSGSSGPPLPIEFVLIGGTNRDALHDPRSCLVGSGWTIENDRSEALLAGAKPLSAHYCRVTNLTAPGKPAYDMLYIYVVDGKVIESATQIRAQMLTSALLGKKYTPVYYLRFLREVDSEGAATSTSQQELRRFAEAMWQKLSLIKS